MSGERARSWATSRGSGRGAPCPSRTTMPTTGARCISWISLAAIHEKNVSAKRRVCKKSQITTSFKTKLSPHLVVPRLLHLLGAQRGECGAYTQKHSRRLSLPIGRVYYVRLRENNKTLKTGAVQTTLLTGCPCDSLSVRKVSAKYSVRTSPVKESSEERASIFLWTGASSISASSASRRALASWSYAKRDRDVKTKKIQETPRRDFPLVGHLPWRCC